MIRSLETTQKQNSNLGCCFKFDLCLEQQPRLLFWSLVSVLDFVIPDGRLHQPSKQQPSLMY